MRKGRSAKTIPLALLALATAAGLSCACAAAGTPQVFYFSIRFYSQPAPTYISAAATAGGTQTTPIAACDGTTYFVSASDSAQISQALSSGARVQLHADDQGTPPENAGVVCMMGS
jgi:hypothetical protein